MSFLGVRLPPDSPDTSDNDGFHIGDFHTPDTTGRFILLDDQWVCVSDL